MTKLESLQELVAYAIENIPFYGNLQQVHSFDQFAQFPIVTHDRLAQTTLACTVKSLGEIEYILEPFGKQQRWKRVLSDNDYVNMDKVLEWLMDDESNDVENASMMMVSDPENIYSLSDITLLMQYWEMPLAALSSRDDSIISSALKKMQPTYIFLACNDHPHQDVFPEETDVVFTFNLPHAFNNQHFAHVDFLTQPYCGIFAARDMEDDVYTYNPEHFYLETDVSNNLLVTSLLQRLQPVIRYQTAFRAVIPEIGKLIVEEYE